MHLFMLYYIYAHESIYIHICIYIYGYPPSSSFFLQMDAGHFISNEDETNSRKDDCENFQDGTFRNFLNAIHLLALSCYVEDASVT